MRTRPAAGRTGYQPQDAAEAFGRILDGTSPQVALGDFLDDWRRTGVDERTRLVERPIAATTDPTQRRWAAFLAAAVEMLCAQEDLAAPDWVRRAEYRLEEPWFLLSGASIRGWLLVTSPVPFKRRNIFTGDSPLARA